MDIITEALPDSTISENVFDCYEQDASSSQQDIESWLSELGILKTFVKIKKTFERIASLVHDNSAKMQFLMLWLFETLDSSNICLRVNM